MNHLIHCPCGEVIVKSLGPDTKIRAKILVFRDTTAYAVCKSCDSEVQVPLQINEEMMKSMASSPPSTEKAHVPLYIRTVKRSTKSS